VKYPCSILPQRRYILLISIKLVIIDIAAVKRNFRHSSPNAWANVTSRIAVKCDTNNRNANYGKLAYSAVEYHEHVGGGAVGAQQVAGMLVSDDS